MRNAVKVAPTSIVLIVYSTLSIESLKVLSFSIFRWRNLEILEIPDFVIFLLDFPIENQYNLSFEPKIGFCQPENHEKNVEKQFLAKNNIFAFY